VRSLAASAFSLGLFFDLSRGIQNLILAERAVEFSGALRQAGGQGQDVNCQRIRLVTAPNADSVIMIG